MPIETTPKKSPEGPREISVEFIEPQGVRRTLRVPIGQTLLDAALEASIQGIGGQCGGAINCATCLCELEAPPGSESPRGVLCSLPAQHPDEIELLEWVDEATTNSRLTCQLVASSEMDGLILRVLSPA